MPKRKEPELTPEKQFEEFVKTARKHEVDETGKEFDEAFNRVVRPSSRPDTKPKK